MPFVVINVTKYVDDSKLENPNRELKEDVGVSGAVVPWERDSKLENPNRELKATPPIRRVCAHRKDSKLENPNRELKGQLCRRNSHHSACRFKIRKSQ